MDRLSILLTLVTGSVLVGGLVIVVLAFGWYGWMAILAAVALGMILTWPVSYAISRRIKRRDPDWDARRIEKVRGKVPSPDDPEV